MPDKGFAVVTGASSGIGLELARQFVDNGFEVLITAEDEELVTARAELAADSDRAGRPQVDLVQADLATTAGVEQLLAAIGDRPVDALALNAGIGNGGRFVEIPLEDEQRLIALNVGSTVHLAKRLLPGMVRRGAGRILFTASVAGTQPGPFYATYAASKAFVLSFAEALRYEVKDSGVTITALMPGPTDTEFFDRADMNDTRVDSMNKDDPAEVARDGYEALMAGKDHVVAGSFKNKLQAGAKGLPEPAKAAMHAKMTEPESS
jgi:short-subunit dehydrogenase